MESTCNLGERYLGYIFKNYPDIDASILSSVEIILENTNWETPKTDLDWNNLAVIDLIEAEQSEDLEKRTKLVQSALQKLETGFSLGESPHCAAHYAIVQSMLGEINNAMHLAFNSSLAIFQPNRKNISLGLVYLPLSDRSWLEFGLILNAENGFEQALKLLAEALIHSRLIFYGKNSIRFIRLANQLFADSPNIYLMLGIAELLGEHFEGIIRLQKLRSLSPNYAPSLQALYIGCRDISDLNSAGYWLEIAKNACLNQNCDTAEWEWAKLSLDSEISYVAFEEDLILAVEPSFRSIVTAVLIAQGDWFEREIEFWRNQIQLGMTVIDVGANAGVYTFSAAKRVGHEGLVLSIEPFSQCVTYLNETCRINQLDWVKVCAGAASDRNGTAKLALNDASESNEIISEEDEWQIKDANRVAEVECFTLDSLIEKYGINRVDFLKIDAEGHEIQVLKGSDRLLTEFAPIILYENLAREQVNNLPVADFLRNIGYQLFRYQPYLQKLIPINSHDDFQGSLNVIAVPQKFIA